MYVLAVASITVESVTSSRASLDVAPSSSCMAWPGIVLHHSATGRGSVDSFDEYHRSLGWDGMGDGEAAATFRWTEGKAGAHRRGHNGMVGILLGGGTSRIRPPRPPRCGP